MSRPVTAAPTRRSGATTTAPGPRLEFPQIHPSEALSDGPPEPSLVINTWCGRSTSAPTRPVPPAPVCLRELWGDRYAQAEE